MRRPIVVVAAVVALAVLAPGCGPSPAPRTATDRPVVAVTVAPLAWFVERLAGAAVEIDVLLPPGASPEQFEPSIGERKTLRRAAVLVEIGHPALSFEAVWLAPRLSEFPGLRVVAAWTRGPGGDHDPHVWLAPDVALDLVDALAPVLTEVVPDRAADIEARRNELHEQIEQLDRDIARRLAPYRGRRFYVFHPAWGAFAARYGLVQVAAEEHGAEPGPEHLAALIDLASAERARRVFVQPQFPERGIRVLADEVGADVEVLDPLAADWADNLERTVDTLVDAFRAEDAAAS